MKIKVFVGIAAAMALTVTAFAAESVPMTKLTPAQNTNVGIEHHTEKSDDRRGPGKGGRVQIEKLRALRDAILEADTDEEKIELVNRLQEMLDNWDKEPEKKAESEATTAGVSDEPVVEGELEFEEQPGSIL